METMKRSKRRLAISLLTIIAMVFTMIPMIPGAVSKAYAEELTKISSLEATSKFADNMKVGKTVPGSLPFPVVTVGQPANVNPVMMLAVYKKNDGGGFSYVPSNTPVEPGIYRFKTYVSLIQGQGYELDPEMTVTIDGKTCTHDGTITVRNGDVDTITITSGEYEVVAPPDLVFTDSDTLDIPMGEVNKPIDTFSLALYANGGTAPYTFSKKSGPEWITVSPDGKVSGTPTQVIDANEDLVVQVTDSTDPVQTAEISISVGKTYSPIAVTYVNLSCIALDNIFNIGNAVTIPGNSKFMVTGSSLSDSSVIGINNDIGNSPKWKKFESNTWTDLTSTDVFERGGTYKLTGISFYADHTKVKFDEDTVVTVNGNEWEISYIGQNPGYRYVEIESPAVTLREELKEENVALDLGVYTYDGAAKEPATIVKNAADEVLVEGTDYEVSYTNNTSAGTAEVTVTGIGNYSGMITKNFTIAKQSSSKCKASLSTINYTYNGKAKTPSVTVKNAAGATLKNGTDYTVSYASGRKNVGSYKVTVTFKGDNYIGSKFAYFNINPKGTSISKLYRAKKAFTVKWKKQSAKMATSTINGYQIRYSTSSKMTNAKYKTVKGYKSTSKKITKLSSKKKYYVQVRTYKTVSGKTYYSSWSSIKSVKTK